MGFSFKVSIVTSLFFKLSIIIRLIGELLNKTAITCKGWMPGISNGSNVAIGTGWQLAEGSKFSFELAGDGFEEDWELARSGLEGADKVVGNDGGGDSRAATVVRNCLSNGLATV